MTKQRLQGFIAGVLISALLIGTFAIASPFIREVFYDVNVVINGELMEFDDDMQPFISNGRTFLPIRRIAEALHIHTHWDSVTSTVYLIQLGEPPADHAIIGEWRLVGWQSLDGEFVCANEMLVGWASFHWPNYFENATDEFIENFIEMGQSTRTFFADGTGYITDGPHTTPIIHWSANYGLLITVSNSFITGVLHYSISENQLTIRPTWIYERIEN